MVVVFVVAVVAVVGLVVVAGVVVFLGVILTIVFLGVVVVNIVDDGIEVLDAVAAVAVSCTTTRGEMTEMRPNLPKAQPTDPRIRLACTIFFLYSNFLSENGEKKLTKIQST
jgi:hypothetical protein